MQLETMQYFDSTMQDAPAFDKNFDFLQWAISGSDQVFYPDKIDGQRLYFNNGHGMSELTTYSLRSKNLCIKTHIKIINANEVEVLSNIESLKGEFSVFLERRGAFNHTVENGYNVFTKRSWGFKVKRSLLGFFIGDSESNYNYPAEGTSNPECIWRVFLSEDAFFLCYSIDREQKSNYGFGFFQEASGERVHLFHLHTRASEDGYIDLVDKKTGGNVRTTSSLGGNTLNIERINNRPRNFLPIFSNATQQRVLRVVQDAYGYIPIQESGFSILYAENGYKFIRARCDGSSNIIFLMGGSDEFFN